MGYFGDAYVQILDFTTSVLDKSKVKVLIPKKDMPLTQMYFIASYLNNIKKMMWSYTRYCGIKRLKELIIPDIPETDNVDIDLNRLLPKKQKNQQNTINKPPHYTFFELGRFFTPLKGEGEYIINLGEGNTPIISATNENNGVAAYVDADPIFKAPMITVERVSGTAFVQLSDFITVPDDLLVLEPTENTTLNFYYL